MGIPKQSEVGQSDLHMHVVEGMPLKEKKRLKITVSFVDNRGNKVADTAEEFFEKATQLQCNIFKAACLEVITGKRHKPQ